MKLNLYRRHRPGCESGKSEDSRSTERDERRKGWGRKCFCQIHLSGTLDGKFSRKATRTSDWVEAQRIADAYEKADSWTGKPRVEPVASEPAGPAPRTTIPDAIKVYLSTREAANLAPASLRKYGVFTRKLQRFADTRGYVMLDQLTRVDIDVFYSTSSLGIRSKAKMLDTLRTFFRFCVNRELVATSPVSPDLKPPIGANRVANKLPFTDEQLADIIKACDQLNGYKKDGRWGNRFGSGNWMGDDLKDFIWFMTHTGLRISDVVMFDIDRMHGNEVFLRARKNGGEVFVSMDSRLAARSTAGAGAAGRQAVVHG